MSSESSIVGEDSDPSKTIRPVAARLPLSDAAWVEQEAESRGWTVSRVVARWWRSSRESR